MSARSEFESTLRKLSPEELLELRNLIDEFLEDHLEISDEVVAKIEQSKREIAAGQFTIKTSYFAGHRREIYRK